MLKFRPGQPLVAIHLCILDIITTGPLSAYVDIFETVNAWTNPDYREAPSILIHGQNFDVC